MGKAADNERIKLRAAFYNNLSVGSVLGGIIVPYLSFFTNPPKIVLEAGGLLGPVLWFGGAILLALSFMLAFLIMAHRLIGQIQD